MLFDFSFVDSLPGSLGGRTRGLVADWRVYLASGGLVFVGEAGLWTIVILRLRVGSAFVSVTEA